MKLAPAQRGDPWISTTLCDMTQDEHNALKFLAGASHVYHPSYGQTSAYIVVNGRVHIVPNHVSFPIGECEFVFFKGGID